MMQETRTIKTSVTIHSLELKVSFKASVSFQLRHGNSVVISPNSYALPANQLNDVLVATDDFNLHKDSDGQAISPFRESILLQVVMRTTSGHQTVVATVQLSPIQDSIQKTYQLQNCPSANSRIVISERYEITFVRDKISDDIANVMGVECEKSPSMVGSYISTGRSGSFVDREKKLLLEDNIAVNLQSSRRVSNRRRESLLSQEAYKTANNKRASYAQLPRRFTGLNGGEFKGDDKASGTVIDKQQELFKSYLSSPALNNQTYEPSTHLSGQFINKHFEMQESLDNNHLKRVSNKYAQSQQDRLQLLHSYNSLINERSKQMQSLSELEEQRARQVEELKTATSLLELEHKQQLDKLKDQLAEIAAERDNLIVRSRTLEEHNTEVQANYEKTTKELKNALYQKQLEITQILKERSIIEQEVGVGYMSSLHDIGSHNRAISAENQKLRKQVYEIKQELTKVRGKGIEIQDRSKSRLFQLENLRSEKAQLNEELAQLNDQLKGLKAEFIRVSDKLTEAEESLGLNSLQVNINRASLESERSNVCSLESQLRSMNDEANQQQQIISDLTARKESLVSELQDTNKHVQSLEDQTESLQSTTKKLASAFEQVKESFERSMQELENDNKELSTLAQQKTQALTETQRLVSQQFDSICRLEKEKQKIVHEQQTLQKQLKITVLELQHFKSLHNQDTNDDALRKRNFKEVSKLLSQTKYKLQLAQQSVRQLKRTHEEIQTRSQNDYKLRLFLEGELVKNTDAQKQLKQSLETVSQKNQLLSEEISRYKGLVDHKFIDEHQEALIDQEAGTGSHTVSQAGGQVNTPLKSPGSSSVISPPHTPSTPKTPQSKGDVQRLMRGVNYLKARLQAKSDEYSLLLKHNNKLEDSLSILTSEIALREGQLELANQLIVSLHQSSNEKDQELNHLNGKLRKLTQIQKLQKQIYQKKDALQRHSQYQDTATNTGNQQNHSTNPNPILKEQNSNILPNSGPNVKKSPWVSSPCSCCSVHFHKAFHHPPTCPSTTALSTLVFQTNIKLMQKELSECYKSVEMTHLHLLQRTDSEPERKAIGKLIEAIKDKLKKAHKIGTMVGL